SLSLFFEKRILPFSGDFARMMREEIKRDGRIAGKFSLVSSPLGRDACLLLWSMEIFESEISSATSPLNSFEDTQMRMVTAIEFCYHGTNERGVNFLQNVACINNYLFCIEFDFEKIKDKTEEQFKRYEELGELKKRVRKTINSFGEIRDISGTIVELLKEGKDLEGLQEAFVAHSLYVCPADAIKREKERAESQAKEKIKLWQEFVRGNGLKQLCEDFKAQKEMFEKIALNLQIKPKIVEDVTCSYSYLVFTFKEMDKFVGHKYYFRAVDIRALLEEAMEDYKNACSIFNIKLSPIKGVKRLPLVDGEAKMLLMAIKRVYSNSLYYLKKKIKEKKIKAPRIDTFLFREKNWIRIEISDNAGGIPLEMKEKIFILGQSSKLGGSGVGCNFLKQVVEDHGGKVWEEGSYGEGVKFIIKLPGSNPVLNSPQLPAVSCQLIKGITASSVVERQIYDSRPDPTFSDLTTRQGKISTIAIAIVAEQIEKLNLIEKELKELSLFGGRQQALFTALGDCSRIIRAIYVGGHLEYCIEADFSLVLASLTKDNWGIQIENFLPLDCIYCEEELSSELSPEEILRAKIEFAKGSRIPSRRFDKSYVEFFNNKKLNYHIYLDNHYIRGEINNPKALCIGIMRWFTDYRRMLDYIRIAASPVKKHRMAVIIVGPSGVGKDELIDRLTDRLPSLRKMISFTTRKQRAGEVDGLDYWFIDKEKFARMIEEDKLIEWTKERGDYYGTAKEELENNKELDKGEARDIVFNVEVKGAEKIRVVLNKQGIPYADIFISPIVREELFRDDGLTRAIGELKERLLGRRTEHRDDIKERLNKAKEEIQIGRKYKNIVANLKGNVKVAESQLLKVVIKETVDNYHPWLKEEVKEGENSLLGYFKYLLKEGTFGEQFIAATLLVDPFVGVDSKLRIEACEILKLRQDFALEEISESYSSFTTKELVVDEVERKILSGATWAGLVYRAWMSGIKALPVIYPVRNNISNTSKVGFGEEAMEALRVGEIFGVKVTPVIKIKVKQDEKVQETWLCLHPPRNISGFELWMSRFLKTRMVKKSDHSYIFSSAEELREFTEGVDGVLEASVERIAYKDYPSSLETITSTSEYRRKVIRILPRLLKDDIYRIFVDVDFLKDENSVYCKTIVNFLLHGKISKIIEDELSCIKNDLSKDKEILYYSSGEEKDITSLGLANKELNYFLKGIVRRIKATLRRRYCVAALTNLKELSENLGRKQYSQLLKIIEENSLVFDQTKRLGGPLVVFASKGKKPQLALEEYFTNLNCKLNKVQIPHCLKGSFSWLENEWIFNQGYLKIPTVSMGYVLLKDIYKEINQFDIKENMPSSWQKRRPGKEELKRIFSVSKHRAEDALLGAKLERDSVFGGDKLLYPSHIHQEKKGVRKVSTQPIVSLVPKKYQGGHDPRIMKENYYRKRISSFVGSRRKQMLLFEVVYGTEELDELGKGMTLEERIENFRGTKDGVGLKGINDLYGHGKGDEEIKNLAMVIFTILKDILEPFGYKNPPPTTRFIDKFYTCIPRLKLETIEQLADRITGDFNRIGRDFDSKEARVTIKKLTISLVLFDEADSLGELFERIDTLSISQKGFQAHKTRGGNLLKIYSPYCEESAREYCQEQAIRSAKKLEEISLQTALREEDTREKTRHFAYQPLHEIEALDEIEIGLSNEQFGFLIEDSLEEKDEITVVCLLTDTGKALLPIAQRLEKEDKSAKFILVHENEDLLKFTFQKLNGLYPQFEVICIRAKISLSDLESSLLRQGIGKVDVVVARYLTPYIDREVVFPQIFRILKTGGVFIFNVFGGDFLGWERFKQINPFYEALRSSFEKVLRKFYGVDTAVIGYVSDKRFSRDTLKKGLEAHRFQVETVSSHELYGVDAKRNFSRLRNTLPIGWIEFYYHTQSTRRGLIEQTFDNLSEEFAPGKKVPMRDFFIKAIKPYCGDLGLEFTPKKYQPQLDGCKLAEVCKSIRRQLLDKIKAGDKIAIFCHSDVDGIASAKITESFLRRYFGRRFFNIELHCTQSAYDDIISQKKEKGYWTIVLDHHYQKETTAVDLLIDHHITTDEFTTLDNGHLTGLIEKEGIIIVTPSRLGGRSFDDARENTTGNILMSLIFYLLKDRHGEGEAELFNKEHAWLCGLSIVGDGMEGRWKVFSRTYELAKNISRLAKSLPTQENMKNILNALTGYQQDESWWNLRKLFYKMQPIEEEVTRIAEEIYKKTKGDPFICVLNPHQAIENYDLNHLIEFALTDMERDSGGDRLVVVAKCKENKIYLYVHLPKIAGKDFLMSVNDMLYELYRGGGYSHSGGVKLGIPIPSGMSVEEKFAQIKEEITDYINKARAIAVNIEDYLDPDLNFGSIEYARQWDDILVGESNEQFYLLTQDALAGIERPVVLDLATGTAKAHLSFAKKLSKGLLVGVDQSEAMLSVAREKAVKFPHLEFSFKQGNIEQLNEVLPSQFKADVVTARFSFNFIKLEKVLPEVFFKLRQGGRLIFNISPLYFYGESDELSENDPFYAALIKAYKEVLEEEMSFLSFGQINLLKQKKQVEEVPGGGYKIIGPATAQEINEEYLRKILSRAKFRDIQFYLVKERYPLVERFRSNLLNRSIPLYVAVSNVFKDDLERRVKLVKKTYQRLIDKLPVELKRMHSESGEIEVADIFISAKAGSSSPVKHIARCHFIKPPVKSFEQAGLKRVNPLIYKKPFRSNDGRVMKEVSPPDFLKVSQKYEKAICKRLISPIDPEIKVSNELIEIFKRIQRVSGVIFSSRKATRRSNAWSSSWSTFALRLFLI
ncbi:MAG: methyltransferase domain-containing protein, partial [Candidatus Omnitrophica bacterium]|nr:methyltransferase domain-containing protein [Candidatus Omnitrophota bacterium]